MEHLPAGISILFIATTFLAVLIFYKATQRSATSLILLLLWLAVQTVLGRYGFYTDTQGTPPKLLLLILPPLLLLAGLFSTAGGRRYIDGLNIKTLTILHIVRIPVEVVLFYLSVYKAVPVLMTFEGRNFDILSGLTAPVIFYFGFVKKHLSTRIILTWNFICLGLLINIVVHAILSAPFPFQQFAFDQPNIAILHFPFIWLPGCVVPLVLCSHLVAIRRLIKEK